MTGTAPAHHLTGRYWATLAVVSIGVAVIVAFIHASPASPAVFQRALLRSLIYSATITALGGGLVPVILGWLTPRRSRTRWLSLVLSLIIVGFAGTIAAGAIIGAAGLAPGEPLWERVRADGRVVALLAVAVGVAVALYERLRTDLDAATAELHARELRQERAEKLAVEARLAALESRLHPHFIFNALNAVAALVHDEPDRAERIVERLAALLRFSLDAAARGSVPLADELQIVGDYLEI